MRHCIDVIRHFPVLHIPVCQIPVRHLPVRHFSDPQIPPPATSSAIFQSCIFHPRFLVVHHCHPLRPFCIGLLCQCFKFGAFVSMEEKRSQISVLIIIEFAFPTQTQVSYSHTPRSLSLLRCARPMLVLFSDFACTVYGPEQ